MSGAGEQGRKWMVVVVKVKGIAGSGLGCSSRRLDLFQVLQSKREILSRRVA